MSGRLDLDPLIGDHVIGQMRIDRRAHRVQAGFDVGEKAQQRRQIVALRKALLLHQAFAIEHGIGVQKTVGGDETDLGHVRPAAKQGFKDARRGRFAHRNRAADADDIRHLGVFGAEKALLRAEQPLRRHHIKREQARQRQIDFLDLRHIETLVHRAQPRDLGRLERHRRVLTQPRPFAAREHAVGRDVLLSALLHDVQLLALSRFYARPSRQGPTGACGHRARPRLRRA